MARGFDGATDRIDYANVDAIAGQAQTFSALVYSDDNPGTEYVFTQDVAADNAYSVNFRIRTNRDILFVTNNATQFLQRISNTGVFPDAEFFHLLYTWDGGLVVTNLHIYVNGSEVGYASEQNGIGAHVAPAGLWSLGGAFWNDDVCFDGGLAECGWWNRVLTADEIAMLAKVFSPRFIPNGLKFAPDLVRHQRDPISGQVGILDGTTVRPHPRIILPAGPQLAPPSKIVYLAGSIAIQSGMSGALKVSRKLSGWIAIDSEMTGALKVSRKLSGSIAIQSGVSGILTIQKENVRWSAGLFTFQGVTYEIAAGETNKRFIYWDPNYTTMFRATDDIQDVLNVDGWIMCIGESGVASPVFARKLIHGGIIQAGTITAEFGQIADAAITTAKIENLAVETAKVKDNAITFPVSAFTIGAISITGTVTVQSIGFTSIGEKLFINWSIILARTGLVADLYIKIYRDSTEIYNSGELEFVSVSMPVAGSIEDSPGAGTYTYYLKVTRVGGDSYNATNRFMYIHELKK